MFFLVLEFINSVYIFYSLDGRGIPSVSFQATRTKTSDRFSHASLSSRVKWQGKFYLVLLAAIFDWLFQLDDSKSFLSTKKLLFRVPDACFAHALCLFV